MSPRAEICPHCGHEVESNEEFCTACGAWVYGGPDWPAPPKPVVMPKTVGNPNPDAEPIPLTLPEPAGGGFAPLALRVGAVLTTVAAAAAWIYAEMMIVDRDDRLNWDIAWIAAAAVTIPLVGWLLLDAYRRAQARGWDHAWRVWESPGW